MRTFGVEEELLLVHAETGAPVAAAPRLLGGASHVGPPALEAELQQEMLEVVGPVCRTLDELARGVDEGRRRADESARAWGTRAVPLATSPLPVMPHHSTAPRYREMTRRYGVTARRTLTCGFHVHVSIASEAEGVGALDRLREWLPILLAFSSNSPFWDGVDTGYASYRSDVWSRWPCAGPNPVFGSVARYREHERETLATGTLLDAGMLYFDARLSRHQPTLEIRIADICREQDDAVTLAALGRALVETAAEEWRRGVPAQGTDERLLRLAGWRAAMSGVRGELVHPVTGRPCSSAEAARALLDHVRPALVAAGDLGRVESGLAAILERGTGADRQRADLARRGRLVDVVLGAARRAEDAAVLT